MLALRKFIGMTIYSIFHLYEVHLNPSPTLPSGEEGAQRMRGWGVLHLLAIRCMIYSVFGMLKKTIKRSNREQGTENRRKVVLININ